MIFFFLCVGLQGVCFVLPRITIQKWRFVPYCFPKAYSLNCYFTKNVEQSLYESEVEKNGLVSGYIYLRNLPSSSKLDIKPRACSILCKNFSTELQTQTMKYELYFPACLNFQFLDPRNPKELSFIVQIFTGTNIYLCCQILEMFGN